MLYPGNVGLTEPAPPPSTVGVADALKRVELRLMDSLQHQRQTEQCYIKEAFSLARCVVCVGVCGGGVRGVCVGGRG